MIPLFSSSGGSLQRIWSSKWVNMEWSILSVSLFIGTLAVFIESIKSVPGNFAGDDKKSKAIREQRKCFGFPNDLTYESEIRIGWSYRWKNQCPEGTLSTALWAPSRNATVQDMKCCKGQVDQTLSEVLAVSEWKDKGDRVFNQTMSFQCSGNYVVTGIKILSNGKSILRVAGIKCSAVFDKQIDRRSCTDVEFNKNNGKTRDPALIWSQECRQSKGLVGLYSVNGFSSVKYGRCCDINDVIGLSLLPMSCSFKPTNMCGWTVARASALDWEVPHRVNGDYILKLKPEKPSGSASLTSPAYSFTKSQVCMRITYALIFQAALKIYVKSYRKGDKMATIKEVLFTQYRGNFEGKDVLIDVSSNFQVIVEANRLRNWQSTVMIKSIGFVESSQCQVDQCTPQFGCGIHESCIPSPPHGLTKCVCKNGYERLDGKCIVKRLPTETPTTKHNEKTIPITGGQDRGGDGSGDVVTSKSKVQVLLKSTSSIKPWMYTAIGAICGTLLVVFLILSFLTYRRRRLTRRTYEFNFDVNYLRARSMSDYPASDNNNSYVMEPTSIQEICTNFSEENDLQFVPNTDPTEDGASIRTGTPPSHHYFEVEPEFDLERQTSQMTLITPVYGSCEDDNELFGEKEVFLEPPNDEKELCSQLDREIDWRKLKILHENQLGQGAFGYVHYGIWKRSDGEHKGVAIKSMKDSNSAEERIKFLQEAAIMKQFAHQNVVFMFGVVTKRYPPMIVLEYMKNGNLRKFLRRERKQRISNCLELTDRDLQKKFLKMAREIAAGMTYLSGMQFVHRDLAARNILLDDNMVCKIGDFGLARDLIGCNHYISQGGQIPVKWTSPEALSFRRYSSASDVWSFGVLLYEIWSVGKKPYEEWSNDEVIENVCNKGYRLPPPSGCPRVVYHLMIDCWHPEESQRPKFSQIKFCLAQKDERLLGRQNNVRVRSATLNDISCETIKEERYGELQNTYCKTD